MYEIHNKTLYLNSDFNRPLTEVTFPKDIHQIVFGVSFNQEVNNLLPNHITHITLNYAFNKDISKLPKNLKTLSLGYNFNQELNNLPISLKCLSFGGFFIKDISRASTLPKYLKYLYINLSVFHKSPKPNPYLYYIIGYQIVYHDKHTNIMIDRCRVNRHNIDICENKLISLLIR